MDKVGKAVKSENRCVQEEMYYYRLEGWFFFISQIETVEANADGIDYRCLKWEEEPSVGKTILRQRLIHEKGFSEKESKK